MEIRRFFVNKEDIIGDIVTISGDEFLHMTKVLRHKIGYKIIVNNNVDDIDYYAEIMEIDNSCATVRIYQTANNTASPKSSVTLYQALPKGDKIDLIVQKAVELGVACVQIFTSDYVAESKCNAARLNKIALEACKQCGRAKQMQVPAPISFEAMCEQLEGYGSIIFLNENEKVKSFAKINLANNEHTRVALIVGSEGGFSAEECVQLVERGALSISLGQRILRCETASIVGVTLTMFALKEL